MDLQVPCPEALQKQLQAKTLQFTLVDCPGHASLLKTVLVGAQIIDMMLLVVDASKGIQAQTAECIIVGELLSQCAVVALNKTDLFPPESRQKLSRRAGRNVVNALKLTRFAAAEIVPVAAKVSPTTALPADGGPAVNTGSEPAARGNASASGTETAQNAQRGAVHGVGTGMDGASSPADVGVAADAAAVVGAADGHTPPLGIGIEELKAAVVRAVPQLHRDTEKPLLFMADHCFAVKGHGTVLSGAFDMALVWARLQSVSLVGVLCRLSVLEFIPDNSSQGFRGLVGRISIVALLTRCPA